MGDTADPAVERQQPVERPTTTSGDSGITSATLGNRTLADVQNTRLQGTVPDAFPSGNVLLAANYSNTERGGEGQQQQRQPDYKSWWEQERFKQDDNIANGIRGLANTIRPGENLLNPDTAFGKQMQKCLFGAYAHGGEAEVRRFINEVNQHLGGQYTVRMQQIDGRMEMQVSRDVQAEGRPRPEIIRLTTVTANHGPGDQDNKVIGRRLFVR